MKWFLPPVDRFFSPAILLNFCFKLFFKNKKNSLSNYSKSASSSRIYINILFEMQLPFSLQKYKFYITYLIFDRLFLSFSQTFSKFSLLKKRSINQSIEHSTRTKKKKVASRKTSSKILFDKETKEKRRNILASPPLNLSNIASWL